MKVRLFALPLLIAAVIVTALAAAGAVSAKNDAKAAPNAQHRSLLAALVSDIGKFNDRSFNQSQLEGLNRAKAKLKVRILPLQSNSTSDYIPNLTNAVRQKADITIAAGFLLAGDLETVADKYPKQKFAITDYCAKGGTPCVTGSVLNKDHANIMGLDYAANQSGCLVGYLAAEMTKKQGGKQIIGAVGGLHIPPVDIWIAGYRFCAKLFNPKIQVLVGYSQNFVEPDKCKTVAQNQIAQGAQVLFQVAGGCGLGTLNAAAQAHIWGIGVDKDQYNDAKRVLTSGIKRVDLGVFQMVKAVKDGKFQGNKDLRFTLANGGMSVGKINPAVPKKFITAMSKVKVRIVKGKLKVPTKL